MDKAVDMVDSLDELNKVIAINCWKEFSQIWGVRCENCFWLEKDHPKFSLQEEGQSRGTESPERGPVSTRKTDRRHDLRLLSSDWRSWYSSRLRWFIFITLRNDNVKGFDTRWDEVLLSMSKIPSDDVLESLYKWRIRESVQLKTFLELCEMEIQQKMSTPICQKLKTMVKSSMGESKLEQWSRVERAFVALKE